MTSKSNRHNKLNKMSLWRKYTIDTLLFFFFSLTLTQIWWFSHTPFPSPGNLEYFHSSLSTGRGRRSATNVRTRNRDLKTIPVVTRDVLTEGEKPNSLPTNPGHDVISRSVRLPFSKVPGSPSSSLTLFVVYVHRFRVARSPICPPIGFCWPSSHP